jgi:hypothetical protein
LPALFGGLAGYGEYSAGSDYDEIAIAVGTAVGLGMLPGIAVSGIYKGFKTVASQEFKDALNADKASSEIGKEMAATPRVAGDLEGGHQRRVSKLMRDAHHKEQLKEAEDLAKRMSSEPTTKPSKVDTLPPTSFLDMLVSKAYADDAAIKARNRIWDTVKDVQDPLGGDIQRPRNDLADSLRAPTEPNPMLFDFSAAAADHGAILMEAGASMGASIADGGYSAAEAMAGAIADGGQQAASIMADAIASAASNITVNVNQSAPANTGSNPLMAR